MRFLLPAVASMLMLGFACGGEEEAADEPTEEKVEAEAEAEDDADEKDEEEEDDGASARPTPPRGKGGKIRGVSFSEAKVTCCSHDRVDKMLAEYLDVQEDLYKDQPAIGNVSALWGQLDTAADDTSLPRASRTAARKAADALSKARDKDNDEVRKHFDEVSVEVYNLVTNHKGSGNHTVAYVFCPASGGRHWFQTASSVQNPYKLGGAADSCGQFQR